MKVFVLFCNVIVCIFTHEKSIIVDGRCWFQFQCSFLLFFFGKLIGRYYCYLLGDNSLFSRNRIGIYKLNSQEKNRNELILTDQNGWPFLQMITTYTHFDEIFIQWTNLI